MTLQRLIEIGKMCGGQGYDALLGVLCGEGIPHNSFEVQGNCQGKSPNGFPKNVGTYQTIAFGILARWVSGGEVGEKVGEKMTVIFSRHISRTADFPDSYQWIAVADEFCSPT